MGWLFVLSAVVSCAFLGVTSADKFEAADFNHDGLLDRQEYASLVHELKQAVDPFLVSDTEAAIPQASSVADWFTSSIHGSMAEDFVSGVLNSLVVIWVTEIGDKTFFIAAVLAMRNGRSIVYLGCMGKTS
jgi:hypothetical protein